MDEGTLIILGLVALGLVVWLMTKRWAWIIALSIGSLASGFSCLASIFHFQILGAIGFFFLTGIQGMILAGLVAD